MEDKAKEPIKVLDRRHFTPEGTRRNPDSEEEQAARPPESRRAVPPAPEGEGPAEAPPAGEPVPSAFTDLVISLAQSCFLSLGLVPNPMTGRPEVNLPAAASMLDMLEMLKDKTRGNLSPQEEQFLDHTLLQLKVGYVQASKAGGAQEGGA